MSEKSLQILCLQSFHEVSEHYWAIEKLAGNQAVPINFDFISTKGVSVENVTGNVLDYNPDAIIVENGCKFDLNKNPRFDLDQPAYKSLNIDTTREGSFYFSSYLSIAFVGYLKNAFKDASKTVPPIGCSAERYNYNSNNLFAEQAEGLGIINEADFYLATSSGGHEHEYHHAETLYIACNHDVEIIMP